MTANKIKQIDTGTPPDTKNGMAAAIGVVQSTTSFVYELRTAPPPTLRQSRIGCGTAELKKALQEGRSANDSSNAKVLEIVMNN